MLTAPHVAEDDHVPTALPKVGIFHPLDLRLEMQRPVYGQFAEQGQRPFFAGSRPLTSHPCWASHIALRPCPMPTSKAVPGLRPFAISTRIRLVEGGYAVEKLFSS